MVDSTLAVRPSYLSLVMYRHCGHSKAIRPWAASDWRDCHYGFHRSSTLGQDGDV